MICWTHLMKRDECPCSDMIDRYENETVARADFLKALVAAESSYSQTTCEGTSAQVVESALATMDEIERRVESGTLFGKGD